MVVVTYIYMCVSVYWWGEKLQVRWASNEKRTIKTTSLRYRTKECGFLQQQSVHARKKAGEATSCVYKYTHTQEEATTNHQPQAS